MFPRVTVVVCFTKKEVITNNQDPVVQNLTKFLANETLKFLTWNMANTLIFFAKATHIFAANIYVFENTLATTVTEFVINNLVKLTLL